MAGFESQVRQPVHKTILYEQVTAKQQINLQNRIFKESYNRLTCAAKRYEEHEPHPTDFIPGTVNTLHDSVGQGSAFNTLEPST